jgi:hypothetical protein
MNEIRTDYISDGRVIRKYLKLDDNSHAEVIVVVNPDGSPISGSAGGTQSATTSTINQLFKASAASTGVSVGDLLLKTEVISIATGDIVSTSWTNVTTNLPITQPASTDISQLPSSSLTDAQLRATPVIVANGKFGALKTHFVDETVTGLTYLLKRGALASDPWLMSKTVEASNITTITYAGVRNNPLITADTAWTNRTTLTYGVLENA